MFLILTILLIIALIGSFPRWSHSTSWGYIPSGIVGSVLLILIILYFMGRL